MCPHPATRISMARVGLAICQKPTGFTARQPSFPSRPVAIRWIQPASGHLPWPRRETPRNLWNHPRHLPAARDLILALITLKYTQSNSVCLAYQGQAIGIGAGQQSRIHCVRLAASKADRWFLRQHPAVLGLGFRSDVARPERNNAIDLYLEDSLSPAEERAWLEYFETPPVRLSAAEKREWLGAQKGVSLASDAFFPFRDNIDRASQSGVSYVSQPGGSVRDDLVIGAADEYGMAMAWSSLRLFHH